MEPGLNPSQVQCVNVYVGMYLRKIIKAETEALKKIKPDVDIKCGVWLVMKRPEIVPSKETEQCQERGGVELQDGAGRFSE